MTRPSAIIAAAEVWYGYFPRGKVWMEISLEKLTLTFCAPAGKFFSAEIGTMFSLKTQAVRVVIGLEVWE